MALPRIKVWGFREELTSADLNGEINNILNNALTLISPLTGNLNANNNQVQNVSTLSFNAGGSITKSTIGADQWINLNGVAAGGVIFNYGATQAGQITSGRLLWGTLQTTGSSAGDIIIGNGKKYGFVQADGSTSTQAGILLDGSNALHLGSPGSSFSFNFGANQGIVFQWANGPQINFVVDSITPVPLAGQAVIYQRTTGGVKELCATFGNGITKVITDDT